MSVTHAQAPDGRVPGRWAGVDWAQDDHAVCVVDADGAVLERFVVAHTRAGLGQMTARLGHLGVSEVGVERGDGPLIEALLAAGFTVLVISPSQVKNLRSRYRATGSKDDRFDAYVLADVVRTDRRRLTPLVTSTPQTLALRATVRARRDLVEQRVAVSNQLRAHLQRVLPGAVGLFSDLDSPISLRFLRRFPTQAKADWLSATRLAAWLSSAGYNGGVDPAVLHARLTAAPRGQSAAAGGQAGTEAVEAVEAALAGITAAYVEVIDTLVQQIRVLDKDIARQFQAHPDRHIFASLPRVRHLRAARLLAEIGDARGRFPTADALACLAGVVPATRQSGKTRTVSFRWSADKQLRDALCDFAGDSRHANPWAAARYDAATARGHDHPHTVRILARSWVDIIWRCWQDRTAYDPAHHGALQQLIRTQEAA